MVDVIDGTKPLTTLHCGVSLILLEFTGRDAGKCSQCTAIHEHGTVDRNLKYTSQYVPSINVAGYIQRISAYSALTDAVLISALIYIDRVVAAKKLVLTLHEIHRYGFAKKSSLDFCSLPV